MYDSPWWSIFTPTKKGPKLSPGHPVRCSTALNVTTMCYLWRSASSYYHVLFYGTLHPVHLLPCVIYGALHPVNLLPCVIYGALHPVNLLPCVIYGALHPVTTMCYLWSSASSYYHVLSMALCIQLLPSIIYGTLQPAVPISSHPWNGWWAFLPCEI